MNIVDFLLARIAEDEKRANYYAPALGTDRVLAESAAKCAIIKACRADHEDSIANGDDVLEVASEVLYALAAVYADHPDYQQEWAPNAV